MFNRRWFQPEIERRTDVACRYLDISTGACTVYSQRRDKVPECLQLTVENLARIHWLPPTCAYRLLREGQPLPPWHPLFGPNNDRQAPRQLPVGWFAVPQNSVPPNCLMEHVIDLTPEGGIAPLQEEDRQ